MGRIGIEPDGATGFRDRLLSNSRYYSKTI